MMETNNLQEIIAEVKEVNDYVLDIAKHLEAILMNVTRELEIMDKYVNELTEV